MHPRFPLLGRWQKSRMLHSLPSNTAGGPFWHEPAQGAVGTQGSLPAPAATVDSGVGQTGGVAGSTNAGSGNWKVGPRPRPSPLPCLARRRLRQFMQFNPRRQSRQPQLSPPDPGNASVVVVGNGEKIHEPVGSIAGRRSWAHPLATMLKTTIASNNNRPSGKVGG